MNHTDLHPSTVDAFSSFMAALPTSDFTTPKNGIARPGQGDAIIRTASPGAPPLIKKPQKPSLKINYDFTQFFDRELLLGTENEQECGSTCSSDGFALGN
uniref:Uncharacterized protein n=1 Tax=Strombidium inclinatum TaxID=197538 RepID=A0A7S3IQ19_9SPIT|eukprot:CAMPEP_0170492960 /NCGR_PEP_ID=MMETSP0208-20121228/13135_1 /TAXON_ID=197538 /ORGANISM="Strombidium inclinatum, Strain S3" /LENGTH=99 /DNA_ID=CAMNT_0010768803 /DNA_START=27 /DNA_END=326 /DNA_ORIENTATION=+